MIIHSKNHVTNLDDKCIQPNAVDVRCSKLIEINAADMRITIGENLKQFFPSREVFPQGNLWTLDPKTSYQFETNHTATIPEGMAGWLIIRSTLSRNGIIMSSGLFDQGFIGNIGGTIHNLTDGTIMLEENCRIGQFIMARSEGDHLYQGFYNKDKPTV